MRNAVAAQAKAAFLGSAALADFPACVRRKRPDAVICSSDTVAAQVLKRLSGAGIRVPEDVMVTGVNDLPLSSLTTPTLTTIHQPCFEIARAAFETLETRLANPEDPPRRIFLPAPLVVRESTAGHFQQGRRHVRRGNCRAEM